MAGYTRQSTFADGDTITAALFNNEFNQLLNAFSNTSGHKHDGTANEGPVIGLIGDAGETSPNNKVLIDTTNNHIEFYVEVSSNPVQQIYISDGAIVPVTDSDVDLGTTSLRFKDTYTDTITTTGNVSVGGNLTVTGTTTFNGGTLTLGDAADDNVVFGADVNSNIIPNTDNTYDLGSSSQEWKDLYVDGIAYLDGINFNGTAITSTAAELNILDGVTSTAAELNILDGVTSTTAELNILDGVTSTTAELNILDGVTATAAEINTLDGITSTVAELNILDGVTASATDINLIDGITNGTVIASKAIVTDANKDISGGRNITITGELDAATLDISGNADIDGTLETDALSINGTTVTSTAAELNLLDGVTATTAELNILDGVTSTAAELNILDGKAFLDEDDMSSNSATGIASQQSIKAYVDSTVAATNEVVEDSTPQLGGDLDLNSNDITGTGNINITGTVTSDGATLDGNLSMGSNQIIFNNNSQAIQIKDAAGTASYVLYQDNADTLIFGNGTNVEKIRLDTSGNEGALIVDTNGNVGIGANPLSKLHVIDAAFFGTTNSGVVVGDNGGIASVYGMNAARDTYKPFEIRTGSSGTGFYQNTSGNVGIGTSSPSSAAGFDAKLQLESANPMLVYKETDQSNKWEVGAWGGNYVIYNGTNERMRIDSSGRVGIGTTSPYAELSIKSASPQVYLETPANGNAQINFNENADQLDVMVNNSSGKIAFGTNSTERMRIDSSGNIGIGTASPSQALHVAGSGSMILNDSTSWSYLRLKSPNTNGGYIQFADADDDDVGQIFYYHGSGGDYMSFTTNAAERVRIDSSGRVGIGTTSPDNLLHLLGSGSVYEHIQSSAAANAGLRLTNTQRSWFLLNDSSGNLQFYDNTASTEAMRIDSSGRVGIGVSPSSWASGDTILQIKAGSGTTALWGRNNTGRLITNAYYDGSNYRYSSTGTATSFENNVASGGFTWSGASSGSAGAVVSFSERMRIDSSGNVGIGTDSPTGAKLQVQADGISLKLDGTANTTRSIFFRNTSSSNPAQIYADGSLRLFTEDAGTDIRFHTNSNGTNNERMRIDSSGKLLVGSTTNLGTALLNVAGGIDVADSDYPYLKLKLAANESVVEAAGQYQNMTVGGTGASAYLRFKTANTERMRIDSSGNVGIGLTNPSEKLEVSGKIKLGGMRLASNDSGRIGLNRNPDDGSGTDSNLQRFQINGPYTGGDYLDFQNYNSSGTYLGGFVLNGGNFGIGDTSPIAKLTVKAASDTIRAESLATDAKNITMSYHDSNDQGQIFCGQDGVVDKNIVLRGHTLIFQRNGGSEAMRIDSNGNIAIGGTSASNFSGYVTLDLRDTTGGLIDFSEASAGVFGRIQAVVNNSLNIFNRQAYPLILGTNDTERMRINSTGDVLIGTTNTDPTFNRSDGICLSSQDAIFCRGGASWDLGRNSTSGVHISFYTDNGSARVSAGNISSSGSTTSFNTTSDARLKDVTGEARGLEVINELNPVSYNWKADGKADEGLIAQEVQEIVPNAVSGSEEEMYQMDYSKLVVHLVKGMKEQQAQIEALQSEINKLKGE